MESLQAFRRADEVRTFPEIQMPAPAAFKVHTGKGTFSRSKDILADVSSPDKIDVLFNLT